MSQGGDGTSPSCFPVHLQYTFHRYGIVKDVEFTHHCRATPPSRVWSRLLTPPTDTTFDRYIN